MATYEIHFHDDGFVVTRVKLYRTEVVGIFPTEALAKAEAEFQASLDDDKARDRAGR